MSWIKMTPVIRTATSNKPQRGASTAASLGLLAAGAVLGAAVVALVMPRGANNAPTASASAPAAGPAADAPSASQQAEASAVALASQPPGEATIRATIASRIPDFPKIDEVTETPVPGVFELRFGTDILYADAKGGFLFEGNLVDTATRANLTAQRIEKLTAIDFDQLDKSDAIVWKVGTGARKVAIFADPNCGFCKRFEREIADVKDITVYTYVIPILGPDSTTKARNLWCSKDRTAAWRGYMLEDKTPAAAGASCDAAALERNLALAKKHRVTGTPAIVFEDGKRVPGAMPLQQFESQLATSARKT